LVGPLTQALGDIRFIFTPHEFSRVILVSKAPQTATMLDAPDGERRLYRRSELADFIAAGRAEVFPYLPESLLDVPALLFGSTDPAKLDSVDIAQYQANGTTISLPPVHALMHPLILIPRSLLEKVSSWTRPRRISPAVA
jgi:hypothetical protein